MCLCIWLCLWDQAAIFLSVPCPNFQPGIIGDTPWAQERHLCSVGSSLRMIEGRNARPLGTHHYPLQISWAMLSLIECKCGTVIYSNKFKPINGRASLSEWIRHVNLPPLPSELTKWTILKKWVQCMQLFQLPNLRAHSHSPFSPVPEPGGSQSAK